MRNPAPWCADKRHGDLKSRLLLALTSLYVFYDLLFRHFVLKPRCSIGRVGVFWVEWIVRARGAPEKPYCVIDVVPSLLRIFHGGW